MSKVIKLRVKLLLNVFLDTIGYCLFSFIMWTTSIIENRFYLFANWNDLPEIARSYLAGQTIYNKAIDLVPAFLLTFIWVFNKHMGGFTADKSREIYNQIKQLNAKGD